MVATSSKAYKTNPPNNDYVYGSFSDEDIVDIIQSADPSLLRELSREEYRYSRIPVYDETIDEIKGILYVKDVLKNINKKNFKVTNIVKEAYFISQNRLINEVFKELQKNKMQIAIIVDEYGGTAG